MKLQIFTPCEKVIQDPKTGPSLIATFQEIGIAIPIAAELPPDAVIPRDWTIFAMWAMQPEDQGKTFSLKFSIHWPNGQLFIERASEVLAIQPDWLSLVAGLSVFPIGQNGRIKVTVWVEHEGEVVAEPFESLITVRVQRDDKLFGIGPEA